MQWIGEDKVPTGDEAGWRFTHTALKRECSLCPGIEAFRLIPCCACEHWVHLECSYGIQEGRLCASHCQILDPLRGVVVTDFKCGQHELRCMVPWRPWVKKYKEEWWSGKSAGKARRNRITHEMLPNLALEKHALLGAGLMWKRMLATTTGIRKGQKTDDGEAPDKTPYKALPLIPVWDELSVQTYHTEFYRQNGVSVLTDVNGLTSLDMTNIDHRMDHGMVIQAMNHPYLLSPPRVPVAGATRIREDTVKVMAFHGIVYSHEGLSDPACLSMWPRSVRSIKTILKYATLDPELLTWSVIRKRLIKKRWDLGGPMQAYAKPTGKEKSMVYNEQSQRWEKAPVPEKPSVPEKGEPEEKEIEKAAVHLKRRSETETDEPKAKTGSVASTKEQPKAVELKPASEVSKAHQDEGAQDAAKAEATAEAKDEKSEKQPHTPRSGLVLKTSEEVRSQEAGEKAPHGESSDGDDAQLAADLQKASSIVTLTPRKGREQRSDPRSDEVVYDEEENQTVFTSSKVTVSGVEAATMLHPRCQESPTRKRQESGEEGQSHVLQKRQRGREEGVNLRLRACLQGMR